MGGAAAGGAGGGGGTVTDGPSTFFADRPPDISPDTRPPDAAPPPDTAVPRDTAPPPDAAVPRDTTPPPTPDAAAPPDTQARDTAPPPPPSPDTAPPPPTPDAAPPDPNAIVVSECSEIPCQELFTMAASCATDGQACVSQITSTAANPSTKVNYCHINGVIKRAALTDDGANYKTVMRVFNANGSSCYTMEMSGAITGDTETQVWKSPAGATLLTGTWFKTADRLLLQCMGKTYDTSMVGCPGLDGEPGTTQCPAGVCPD